jgi:hypothetical protein
MMKSRRWTLGALAVAGLAIAAPAQVSAQDYPKQDIHAVVGFPAGAALTSTRVILPASSANWRR